MLVFLDQSSVQYLLGTNIWSSLSQITRSWFAYNLIFERNCFQFYFLAKSVGRTNHSFSCFWRLEQGILFLSQSHIVTKMKFRRYRYNLTVHNRFIGTRVEDYFDNEKRDTRWKNPDEIRDFCCVDVFNLAILITLKQCDRNATFATIKFDKLN